MPPNSNARHKLIIALDVDELADAQALVKTLLPSAGMFKVGHQLFSRYGPAAVEMVHDAGGKVFLDLKYHDIPNTVKLAVEAATALRVAMLNVHTSGGTMMMAEAAKAARLAAEKLQCPKPIVLGVTILTSLSDADIVELGMIAPVESQVVRLARLAHASGLDGVVASPREIARLRTALPSGFIIVTPGVRTSVSPADDQKRTLSPREALKAGADYLVVGRPILKASDPLRAAQEIASAMLVDTTR